MEKFIQNLVKSHFEANYQAFITFIRKSFPLNGDEITDIYNDVWIDVIENVRRGRTERVLNWKAYIFGLGWKRAYKTVTRRTDMDSIDCNESCEVLYQAYCMKEAERDTSHMDHLRRIESLMEGREGLPEKHRAVLTLYYLKGMSTAEIAESLGYSGARTVITMKKRSVNLLRERMQAVA